MVAAVVGRVGKGQDNALRNRPERVVNLHPGTSTACAYVGCHVRVIITALGRTLEKWPLTLRGGILIGKGGIVANGLRWVAVDRTCCRASSPTALFRLSTTVIPGLTAHNRAARLIAIRPLTMGWWRCTD